MKNGSRRGPASPADRLDADDAGAADALEHQGARGREEIGAAAADVGNVGEAGDPAIGLLDDILEIVGIKCAPQPGAHVGLVGQDFAPDPVHDLEAA